MAYQSIFRNLNPNDGQDSWKMYIRDDKAGIIDFYYKNDVYIEDENGEFETLFGQKCSLYNGKWDKNTPKLFEKDLNKELGALRDLYWDKMGVPSYHNIGFIDIEIEIIGALTPHTIREANAEITSISLYDFNTKMYYCWVLDKKKEFQDIYEGNKKVYFCNTENTLIQKFLDVWVECDFTIITHWNGDFFDMPYLYYRIKKKLGDLVYKLSPIGKILEQPSTSSVKIGLVNSLDLMLLFKKYITKEEPSYKLDEIGTKYVNLGKVEYNGSLNDLFKNDIHTFIEYNIRDVEILVELENKLGFIQLTIQMCHLCNIPYESVYYNTVLNEGAILNRLKSRGIVAPNKPTTVNPSIIELNVGDAVRNQRGTPSLEGEIVEIKGELILVKTKSGSYKEREARTIRKDEGYNGGFLLDPKPGLYDWLSDYDYSSYYPSCIRSLNLGIETFVCRVVLDKPTKELWCSLKELKEMDPSSNITIEKLNVKTFTFNKAELKVSKLIKFIEKNKWNIAANGSIFRTDQLSVVSEILGEWFAMRKEYKKEMGIAYEKGDMSEYDKYDKIQHSYKILLNAMYGAFAINGFRFTDGYKIISSSITCTCQRLLQETILHANKEMDKLLS